MKKMLRKIWEFITWPVAEYKRRKELKARLAELRKRDPFIYK
ncbi:hypothetical protein N9R43_00300 [bacterium]|nr:hypothetical protein [bacterium]